MSIDLNEIHIFTTVSRTGSFTRAAKELEVPKSKVSRKVQELEVRLGVLLFQRTTRHLGLTAAGEIYFQRCAHALQELNEAHEEITRDQTSLQGTLRIAVSLTFGISFLGPLVSEFLAIHPELKVEMMLSENPVNLLKERADVALRIGESEDSGFISKNIGYLESKLFAAPIYFQTHSTPKMLEDLRMHSTLGLINGNQSFPWLLVKVGAPSSKPVIAEIRPRFWMNNFLLIHQRAVAGDGIAYLPVVLCREDVRAGRLVPVLPSWRHEGAKVYLLYPSRKFLPRRVRAFSDFILPKLATIFRSHPRPA